eukprot:16440859-Heterocapsa_arctica.AAC.1
MSYDSLMASRSRARSAAAELFHWMTEDASLSRIWTWATGMPLTEHEPSCKLMRKLRFGCVASNAFRRRFESRSFLTVR